MFKKNQELKLIKEKNDRQDKGNSACIEKVYVKKRIFLK